MIRKSMAVLGLIAATVVGGPVVSAEAHSAPSGGVFSDPFNSENTIPVRYLDQGVSKVRNVAIGSSFHPKAGTGIYLERLYIRAGDKAAFTVRHYTAGGRNDWTKRIVKNGPANVTVLPSTHYAITYYDN